MLAKQQNLDQAAFQTLTNLFGRLCWKKERKLQAYFSILPIIQDLLKGATNQFTIWYINNCLK